MGVGVLGRNETWGVSQVPHYMIPYPLFISPPIELITTVIKQLTGKLVA